MLAQQVAGRQGPGLLLEPATAATESQVALIPIWRQPRQGGRCAIQDSRRVGPQTKARVTGLRHDARVSVLEREQVVRQHRIASPGKRRGCRGLPGTRVPCESDRMTVDAERAGVQAGDATQTQHKRKYWPQQVDGGIFQRQIPRPDRPDASTVGIDDEDRPVTVAQPVTATMVRLPRNGLGITAIVMIEKIA